MGGGQQRERAAQAGEVLGGVVELRTGDVAWFPPGERHWEGATPDHGMTCVALHETTVEFGEEVTDEQYRGAIGRLRPGSATPG